MKLAAASFLLVMLGAAALASTGLPDVRQGLAEADYGAICGDAGEILAALERRGLRRVGSGLSSAVLVFDVFAIEGGAWAIVARFADGISCEIWRGSLWLTEPPKTGPPGPHY